MQEHQRAPAVFVEDLGFTYKSNMTGLYAWQFPPYFTTVKFQLYTWSAHGRSLKSPLSSRPDDLKYQLSPVSDVADLCTLVTNACLYINFCSILNPKCSLDYPRDRLLNYYILSTSDAH